jgi:hypothetical protein
LSFASYHRVLFHHVILTSLCSEVNIYLFLYPKEAFHIFKKTKRKKKASAKQKRAAQKKSEVWLSNFTKPVNLSNFTRAKNWFILPDFTKAANLSIFTRAETGPILLVRFARFYQGCELVRFYQG